MQSPRPQHLIRNDADQDYCSHDGKIQRAGNVEQVDQVSKHLKQRGADHNSCDRTFAAPQTASAEHGGGNRIQLVEIPVRGRRNRVCVKRNQDRRDTGKTASFHTDLRDVELPRHVCFELVRIVQEGLVNVRKHSAATTVIVRFGVRNGCWALEILDNGRGFPMDSRAPSSDFDSQYGGPSIIRERVRAIGGRLIVDSGPGQGTRLEVLIPQGAR